MEFSHFFLNYAIYSLLFVISNDKRTWNWEYFENMKQFFETNQQEESIEIRVSMSTLKKKNLLYKKLKKKLWNIVSFFKSNIQYSKNSQSIHLLVLKIRLTQEVAKRFL
jgi:hypothetical protein